MNGMFDVMYIIFYIMFGIHNIPSDLTFRTQRTTRAVKSGRLNFGETPLSPLTWFSGFIAVFAVGLVACEGKLPMHGHGARHAPPDQATINLQGNDTEAFMANPNIRAFYDLSVKTFADGADKVDFPTYREQSYVLFRAMGVSMGVGPAAMQDHLKDIPVQVLQIVREDPTVLSDFESFKVALIGPP